MKTYKHTDKFKVSVSLMPDTLDTSDNQLFITVEDYPESVSVIIVGEEEIKNLIYASAVHGGLIEEGENLVISAPKVMPKDGVYLLNEDNSSCHVVVEDGRFYVPQYKSDVMLDCTDEYLRRDDWNVIPMRKEES